MDPRRAWELNEAAAKGAARRAAAEATQRSVQGALRSERDRRESQDVEMLDAPPLSNGYGLTRVASSNGRAAPTGLERVLSHSRSGVLTSSNSLGRSLSTDSAISLTSASPGSRQQLNMSKPSFMAMNGESLNRQYSTAFGQSLDAVRHTSGQLHNAGQARNTTAALPQVIDLDSDSPLPLRQRVQQPRNISTLRQNSSGTVDLTAESPPAQAVSRRHTDRIDLDSIGSHTLARSSSGLSSYQPQQNAAQPARNRSQHASRVADPWGSAVDLAGAPSDGNLAISTMYDHLTFGRGQTSRPAANRHSGQQQNHSRSNTQRPQQAAAQRPANDMSQEDLDLALAMSLAAEDEEQAMRFPFNPSQSTHGRAQRQQHFATRPRLSSRALREPSASLTDPFAVLHPTMLLGNMHSAFEADPHAASAIMAALMAGYDESSGASHIGAAAAGGQMQDMSYEALTNLEDVKLTAPPELLATMPLDMCLKGSQWEDKACSVCQCEYEPDEIIMILPCEHHFHKDCITEWLGKHSKKCPICKESIGG